MYLEYVWYTVASNNLPKFFEGKCQWMILYKGSEKLYNIFEDFN